MYIPQAVFGSAILTMLFRGTDLFVAWVARPASTYEVGIDGTIGST